MRLASDNSAAASSEARSTASPLPSQAPHGLRAAAFLVDLALVVALFYLSPGATPWIALPALFVAYNAVLLWLVQRTIGKTLFSLQVHRADGEPTFLWALGRSLGYLVIDVMLIGSLLVFVDRRRRALHDMVFGSEVVYEPGMAGRRLDRLVEFAESSAGALKKRENASRLKPVFVLAALLGSLEKLAGLVKKAVAAAERMLRTVGGSSSSASSTPAGALSGQVVAVIAAATTTVAAATLAVPAVRDSLLAPRAGEHERSSVRLSEIDEGDCIESLPVSQIVPIESVVRIDCDRRHGAEAYVVLEYDEGPFPGQSVLQERAEQECRDRSPSSSDLEWTFLVPYDDATWGGGYRQITCLAFRSDRKPMVGFISGQ